MAWLVAYGKCGLPHVSVKGHTIEEISAVDLDPTAVIDAGGLGPRAYIQNNITHTITIHI